MLQCAKILIAEDEWVTAMDLAAAVEEANGRVLGPVARISEGMEIIHREDIHAAILDVMLIDGEVTLMAQALCARRVVVLFHTASAIPAGITGHAGVCQKPSHPRVIVHVLAGHLERRRAQPSA